MTAFKTLSSQHLILSDCCLKFFQVERLEISDIPQTDFRQMLFRQGYHINSQRVDIINKERIRRSNHLPAFGCTVPKETNFPFNQEA